MSTATPAPPIAAPPEYTRANPRAELMVVTPELAEKWLGRNLRNRNLRIRHYKAMASDILADKWLITGDGPKFDWTGRLINGQHFLHAVITSGKPVKTFVFFDLHPDAQLVMDTPAKRSPSDALKFSGVTGCNTVVLAAIASIGIEWDSGAFRRSRQTSSREITNSEVMEWVENNGDAIDAAVVAERLRKYIPAPPSVLGFSYLQFSRLDADEADEFFADIADMRGGGRGDPIYTLLNRYRNAAQQKQSVQRSQHLFYMFRVWNARRAGEPLYQLKTGTAGSAGGAIAIPEPI